MSRNRRLRKMCYCHLIVYLIYWVLRIAIDKINGRSLATDMVNRRLGQYLIRNIMRKLQYLRNKTKNRKTNNNIGNCRWRQRITRNISIPPFGVFNNFVQTHCIAWIFLAELLWFRITYKIQTYRAHIERMPHIIATAVGDRGPRDAARERERESRWEGGERKYHFTMI